jgi:hypothetical protein
MSFLGDARSPEKAVPRKCDRHLAFPIAPTIMPPASMMKVGRMKRRAFASAYS